MNLKSSNDAIRRLLVANRSEIAIRIFRAATELGIRDLCHLNVQLLPNNLRARKL